MTALAAVAAIDFRPAPDAAEPIYVQLAAALSQAVRGGQIGIGSRLPSERDYARLIGVSRTTVTSAYQELKAMGLIRGYVGRGAIVIADDPERAPAGAIPWAQLAARRAPSPAPNHVHRADLIALGDGWVHPDLLPQAALATAAAKAAKNRNAFTTPAPLLGLPALQEALVETVRAYGVKAMPSEVLVTGGAQQGLNVIARALLTPGDTVVCESATWHGAVGAFRAAGADVAGVAMDHEGVDPEALEDALARLRPKLVYLIPTFQCPTGRVLGLPRRRRIVEICARFHTPIVESHVYGDLGFNERLPTLKSIAPPGLVIHQGSASKAISPALRLGWLIAPRTAMDLLAAAKSGLDLSTPALPQAILAAFLTNGACSEFRVRLRNELRARRDALVGALAAHCPQLRFAVPQGGIYVWAQLPPSVPAHTLEAAAAAEGVSIRSGDAFLTNGQASSHIRLCFAAPPAAEIGTGVERLGKALQTLLARQSTSVAPETAFSAV